MKKIIAIILSAVVTVSFAAAAFAGEVPAIALGGWTVNSDITSAPMTDKAAEGFNKALDGLTGVGYTPIAVLGTQVVAGTNTAYLCAATTVTAVPETYLAIVVIHEDVNGEFSVNSIKRIDLDKLTSEETAEGVSFKMIIKNTLTGEEESHDMVSEVSTLGEFMRTLDMCVWEDSQYGIYVTAINGVANDDEAAAYWSYYVNGEYAMVGADECTLEEGMEITWAYETMSWE